MRERLTSDPAEELVRYILRPRLEGEIESLFAHMGRVNRAHVVMLVETGIIDRQAGSRILASLVGMERRGVASLTLDPNKEDLYFNVEAVVIAELGGDAGGQMHTGRSRNDLYATIHRLKTRAIALNLTARALKLRRRLLEKAAENAEVVMTGYTHMQPGQPITVGHYYAGLAQAIGRDAQRLLDAWRNINLNPLGAGALATTGFPLDRRRTAHLLGFDGLVENSIDAVGSRDYIAELLFGLTTAAINVSRLAHDLQLWCTFEFGYLDMDDSIAGTSSIMPQKKNPSAIEHLKAKPAHLIAALVSSLTCMKSTPFSHGREVGGESLALLPEAAEQAEAVLAVAEAVVRSVRFRPEVLLAAARRNYCTLTELADMLVRDRGLPFRTAHEIVGSLTRVALERGLPGSDAITAELVNAVARDVAGRELDLKDAELRIALDPRFNVEQRSVEGGPAPAATRATIARAMADLEAQESTLRSRSEGLDVADRVLAKAVGAITGEAV
jgi:argininosuccinate lyase